MRALVYVFGVTTALLFMAAVLGGFLGNGDMIASSILGGLVMGVGTFVAWGLYEDHR